MFVFRAGAGGGNSDVQWCFSQVKGAIDDDVAEGKSMWRSVSGLMHACFEVGFNAPAARRCVASMQIMER